MTQRVLIFVAGALFVLAVVCLAGVIYLAAHQLGIPDVLVATTGAAVGSLGTLLAGQRLASGP